MALKITDETINTVLSENAITVIDFWADWCGPCKMLGPVIEQLSTDNTDIAIGKLDVMENKESASRFMITGIPCIVFFKDGNEISRIKGVVPKSTLQAKIDELKN
jgi:thioredoxin 1